MIFDIRAGTVRVLNHNGSTAGAGFIVTDDGLMVTCAHVLQEPTAQAGGEPDHPFTVELVNGDTRQAVLLRETWRPWNAEDIAVLRIQGRLPDAVTPLPLGKSDGTTGHRFETYGFPDLHYVKALRAYGIVGGRVPRTGLPDYLQIAESAGITCGFSGGPVWDAYTGRAIGMVDSFPHTDQYGRLLGVTFATPSESILQVCASLRVVETCPYRPLQAFARGDVGLFFGRGEVLHKIADRVTSDRFVAVLGPSGCGKSSLIQAGVIPKLQEAAHDAGKTPPYEVLVTRAKPDALGDLERQGLTGASSDLAESVVSWCATNCPPRGRRRRLVLVFDQFEELLIAAPASRKLLLEAIRAVLARDLLPVTIVLVMWDAFYSRLLETAPFLSVSLESGTIVFPPILSRAEVEEVIRQPAVSVGLRVEDDLVELILRESAEIDDRGGDSEIHSTVLPLLQLTLADLWEQRQDGCLVVGGYRGIRSALSDWMNTACQQLSDQQLMPYVKRTFIDLVHPGDAARGVPDSRRRLPIADLYRNPTDVTERAAVDTVISRLAGARLLVTLRSEGGEEFIEISQDTIVTRWGELGLWLKDHRQLLDWRRGNAERVKLWSASIAANPRGRSDYGLLRNRELAEVESWVVGHDLLLFPTEMNFIEASRALRTRELAKGRRRVTVLVALLIMALAGGGFASWQW
jgi:energy-coupling factor transporter ATP-binding protein EcfA2